jgi:hypothetical protein
MFEAKSKEINGLKFIVSPFPAVKALKLKVHLLKIIGPAFGQLLGSVKNIKAETEINGESLGGALELLFSSLTEDEFIDILKTLLANTSCEVKGDKGTVLIPFTEDKFNTALDLVFQGKLFTIYSVIGFVLEVNYPDFFGQMEGIGG